MSDWNNGMRVTRRRKGKAIALLAAIAGSSVEIEVCVHPGEESGVVGT